MKIHQTEGDGDILAFLTGQVIPLDLFSMMNRHVKAAPELMRRTITLLSHLFCVFCILWLLNCMKNCLV